jgi:hypothetical protein
MIMRINRYIIDHKMKIMEMGGGEEILLESLNILPEGVTTILINPSLKRDTICRCWLIFILINMIISSWIPKIYERSQEDLMISLRRENEVGDKIRSRKRKKCSLYL